MIFYNLLIKIRIIINKKSDRDFIKRLYNFSVQTSRFINKLAAKRFYWSIGDQLLRSATSVGANIAEVQGASSKKIFINFYHYAFKSFNETIYWLEVIAGC